MAPSLDSSRPRHEQISEWLRENIEAGTFETDEKLPSENELCERFDVSRATIRRALQTLEHEGYIYRRQGLGSFVQEPQTSQGLVRLTDFAQEMAQAGLEASSIVEHHAPEAPPSDIQEHLNTEAQQVMRLDRVRLGNGHPVAFDRTWLPMFYAQLLEDRDLTQETIYRILETEYDIPILRGRYRITATTADPSIAAPLGVSDDAALLLIERLSMTEGGKRVYYQRRYYRSDLVAYELELARDTDARPPKGGGLPLRDFEPVFESDSK